MHTWSGRDFSRNRFRGQIEIFKYREGAELYHLNADYSLRTTQGGQRHFQGGKMLPLPPPPRKIPGQVKLVNHNVNLKYCISAIIIDKSKTRFIKNL